MTQFDKQNKSLQQWLGGTNNVEKSRIRETKNLSTDADCRTDTILERLHDLSFKKKEREKNVVVGPGLVGELGDGL